MGSRIPPVPIGFYDPFTVYPKLQDQLEKNSFITNLHWRKNSSDALKSVSKLPIVLKEETPKRFDKSDLNPFTELKNIEKPFDRTIDVLSTPYARLIFVESESIESYRSKVRPLIEAWREDNVIKSNCPIDWYIVYFVPDGLSHKAEQRVFEKLRTDNSGEDTIERCIRIKESYDNKVEEAESWNALLTKIKEAVIYSFSNRLQILRDGLLNLNDNSNLTILLKEGIARQFLNLNFFEDALVEYDVLYDTILTTTKRLDLQEEDFSSIETFIEAQEIFNREQTTRSVFFLKSYTFSKQFIILEALADKATSISIASLHVSEFLKRLKVFILALHSIFQNSLLVSEWVYKTISEVLELDICQKTLDQEQKGETVTRLSERYGDILLLQRSALVNLAKASKYAIEGVLTDVSLDDEESVSVKHEIAYKPLQEILASKEVFENAFISLTEIAIQHYSISVRPRTVDGLSIDIALLDYQNKQYGKAALVLSNCPEFYGSQGWTYIGYGLLEAYIDCLEHMDESDGFFETSKSTHLSKNYLLLLEAYKNNYTTSQDSIVTTVAKLINIKEPSASTHQLTSLFDLDIHKQVEPLSSGEFGIKLKLTNSLPVDIEIENIEITLKTTNGKGQLVKFSQDSVIIHKGDLNGTVVSLKAQNVLIGRFQLDKVNAKLGPVQLVHSFEDSSEVVIYPAVDDIDLDIRHSTRFKLESRTFSLFVKTQNDINGADLTFFEVNDSIKITGSKDVLEDEILLNLTEGSQHINSFDLKAGKQYEVIIPYSTGPKVKVLDLSMKITYIKNGVTLSRSIHRQIDTTLSVAVSVQDIFKNDFIYSKFSIGTADIELPIRLIDVQLNENESYFVESALKAKEFVAFGEQPGNFFFKIREKEDSNGGYDHLQLNIAYREVQEEVYDIWKRLLYHKLQDAGVEKYFNLLIMDLSLNFDYEEFELNSKIKLNTSDVSTQPHFSSISTDDRDIVIKTFSNHVNDVHDSIPTTLRKKFLSIKVAVPRVQVIHTVELKLDNTKIYTVVGQETPSVLTIKSKINKLEGDIEPSSNKKKVSFQSEDTDKFEVEILTNQDSWLINGKTRFEFDISDNNEFVEKKLSLIPLKVGKLTLPRIKITNHKAPTKDEYLMEVDYRNDNETIYVISENA